MSTERRNTGRSLPKPRESTAPTASRGIQSVEVGCRILRTLVESGEPMMLRDLAVRAGLAPAQAHAYLVSFRRTNLVEQDPAAGTYSIGPFSSRLALSRMAIVQPLASAVRATARLSAELGLMAAVVVWGMGAPTVVHVKEGAHTLNVNLRNGTILPLTGSAAGYAFAAFGQQADMARRIEEELEGRSADASAAAPMQPANYRAMLADVRAQGFAATLDLPVPGLCTLAVPVFGPTGTLELVLTLIGPDHIVDASASAPFATSLLDCAKSLSAGRGWEA